MKKNNKVNKIIILSIIALIFTISLVIFVLNYTKDSSSLSLLEKNWISSHNNKVIDVSVYNDVPIYGQSGEGIIFSFLEKFTNTYDVEFNKISYLTQDASNLKNTSFRILDYNTKLSDDDILLYNDYYVILGIEKNIIDNIADFRDTNIGVFSKDLTMVSYYLGDNSKITFTSCKDYDEMLNFLKAKKIDYIVLPNNLYLDEILQNDLDIVYHISELYNKYVLTVSKDNTFRSILNKFNMMYQDNYVTEDYKKVFLDTFFKYKELSEAERMSYNATTYTYGYVVDMPFENTINKEFVGTFANYLSEFEDLTSVDFQIVAYPNVDALKNALSIGEVDLLFATFNTDGVRVDTLETNSPFKEEYYVLSQKPIVVNSIRSLRGYEISTISNTYLFDYLNKNNISVKGFNDTDDLLRNINDESIVLVNRDTYEYYQDNKFKKYKIVYENVLDNDYKFVVRDVNKNKTFYELFNYYVATKMYKEIKYDYNTDYVLRNKVGVRDMFMYAGICVTVTLLFLVIILIIIKISERKKKLKKEDKLKFIDVMTSLKNRNYLNYNIKTWEDNVIYPQAIIIIDLNNIKYINDNYGHAEGDEVIKKAANILIINQLENTDVIRTDGNEFLIYMVGYDERKVIEYTRVLSKELKELPHDFGATLGYSMILDDVKTIDDAINEATLSMRQAKEKL